MDRPADEFIRAAHDADIPMVGVCFGHQIIAHALGGHAAKSDGDGAGVRKVGCMTIRTGCRPMITSG